MPTTATITPTLGSAPVTLQAGNYSAIDDRRFWGSGVREGVISGGSYQVIQRAAGANMTVDVASSVGSGAIVQGDSVTAQGNYFVPPTAANVNVDIAAADATNPRNDLVVLEVKDDQHDAGGLNIARVRVITGTANASAAATDAPGANGTPALPSSCLLLALVRVTAAASSVTTAMINDRRPWAGGVPTYETSLPSPAVDGQEIYYTSTTAGTGGGSSNTMSGVGAVWHLRYRNAFNGGSTTYPWEFVSGSSIKDEITTAFTRTGSSAFGDPSTGTAGPQIKAALKGEYLISLFYRANNSTGDFHGMGYTNAGGAAVDYLQVNAGASVTTGLNRTSTVTVATAGDVLFYKVRNANPASTVSGDMRWIQITPIRVGP